MSDDLDHLKKGFEYFSSSRASLRDQPTRDLPTPDLPDGWQNWTPEEEARFWFPNADEQTLKTKVKTIIYHRRCDELDDRHKDNYVRASTIQMWTWNMSEETLRARVIPEMPLYKPDSDGNLVPMTYVPPPLNFLVAADMDLEERDQYNPNGWWFKKKDASFFEALHPELCGVREDNPWDLPEMVATTLCVSPHNLVRLVLDHRLRVFRLDREVGVTPATLAYVQQYGLAGCLFKPEDVEKFEEKDRNALKKRRKKLLKDGRRKKNPDTKLFLERYEKKKDQLPAPSDVAIIKEFKEGKTEHILSRRYEESTYLGWIRQYWKDKGLKRPAHRTKGIKSLFRSE